MDLRPMCKYGKECYRLNDQHQKQYQHPKKRKRNKEDSSGEEQSKKKELKEEDHKIAKLKLGETNAEDSESEKEKEESETEKVESESEKETEVSETEKVESETEKEDSESEKEETETKSPVDVKDFINSKYLVDFPDDLYLMWQFCVQQNSFKPEETFNDTLNLKLVGPFDILAGNHKGKKNKDGKKTNFLLHWRYYYDPPEFTTLMKGDSETQFHIGYYRDDPNCMPDFVASNSANENGYIRFEGENLFSAIKHLLEEKIKSLEKNVDLKKMSEKQLKDLCEFCKKNNLELDYKTLKSKRRDKKIVCKTLHGAGIVVPVDDNGVGYRPVPETQGDLKKMLKKIVESKTENERQSKFEPLQELITYIQFANDECDYGEGLELGLDLFTYGGEVFHSTILTLLPLAYQLLGRPQYAQIIKIHLKYRNHTSDLSQIF